MDNRAYRQGRRRTVAVTAHGQNESTALPDLSRIATQVTAKALVRAGAQHRGFPCPVICDFVSPLLCFLQVSRRRLRLRTPLPPSSMPVPPTASAPTSAEVECLPRPGKSTADGQHWVYRVEGQRRCWFQVAEGTEMMRKPVQHRATKHRVATAEANKIAARKRKAVVDAHAELPGSAPVDTSRPSPAALAQVVDAGPDLATGITRASPAPFSKRTNDRPTPNEITPRQVDVEALLAAAPAQVTWLPTRRLRRRRSPFPLLRRAMMGGAGPGLACC